MFSQDDISQATYGMASLRLTKANCQQVLQIANLHQNFIRMRLRMHLQVYDLCNYDYMQNKKGAAPILLLRNIDNTKEEMH